MTFWNRTYGSGWRAGMSEPQLVRPGGTRGIKVIKRPHCPFKKPTQWLSRMLWWMGYHDGLHYSLITWLQRRRYA